MRASRLLIFAVTMTVWCRAEALEKCIFPDGKITYSEQACPKTAKSVTLGSPAKPAPSPAAGPAGASPSAGDAASVSVARDVAVRYYQVQGKEYQSVLEWIYAHGGFHAQAEWIVTNQAQTRPAAGACKVDSVATKLILTMNLPRWSVPDRTSRLVENAWNRYAASLQVHQEGHLQIGREFERALKEALAPMTGASCETLNGLLKVRYNQLLQQFQARDLAYDKETAYGAKQGAEFSIATRKRR